MTQSSALSKQHQHSTLFLAMFLGAWIISGLAHVKSFSVQHTEPDEHVYLSLSREMNWDLSHYTTMDDPVISRFPSAAHRHPLFIHPPFYPLILKTGALFGQPIMAGLLFANLSIGLMLLYAWRTMVMLQISPRWAVTVFLGITFCPLLLFSTARLQIDGLLGIWLTCAIIAYIEALDTGSIARALLAGVMMVIAMNMRYSGIVALPLVFLIQGYHLYRLTKHKDPDAEQGCSELWNIAAQGRHWVVFAIVLALVLTFGLQHYYRVFATFQTLLPSSIAVLDPNAADFSPFLRLVLKRNRWQTLFYLAAIFPVLVIFLTPYPYRLAAHSVRMREWDPAFLFIFFYFLLVTEIFTHQQMRYFALAMPALYLYLPVVLERSGPRMKAVCIGLCVVTLWMMMTTGFLWTIMGHQAAAVIPSANYYFPFLEPLFDINWPQ